MQRPIPIWIGGRDDRVLRRAGQLADGWLTQSHQVEEGQEAIDRLRAYATEAGRDPDSIGIEARVGSVATRPPKAAAPMCGGRKP